MEPRTRLCSKRCGNNHLETRRRPKHRQQTAQEELDVRLDEQQSSPRLLPFEKLFATGIPGE